MFPELGVERGRLVEDGGVSVSAWDGDVEVRSGGVGVGGGGGGCHAKTFLHLGRTRRPLSYGMGIAGR